MRAFRLVLVIRRCWPFVGGQTKAMTEVAVGCREQGHDVRIVTGQWSRDWPESFCLRGVPVTRLPRTGAAGWGTLRFMLSLSRWLRQHADRMDLVYVDGLRYEAYTTLRALRGAAAVVLRGYGIQEDGDGVWQQAARFGRRVERHCALANAIVASSPPQECELAAAFGRERVHLIPNGVAIPEAIRPERRRAARAAMAEANYDLNAPDSAPVVLYTGALRASQGLFDLIDAWTRVVRKFPQARLWLIGDGPLREPLYFRIRDLGLQMSVFLPGTFDEPSEAYDAADVFVLPSYRSGTSLALLEAMARGLATVATDTPGPRTLITHDIHGLLVPKADPGELAKGILRLLSSEEKRRQLGDAARLRVQSEFSRERMVSRHVELFQSLLG